MTAPAATKTAPIRPATFRIEIDHGDGRRRTIAKPAHAASHFAKAFNRAAAARGSDARATVTIR